MNRSWYDRNDWYQSNIKELRRQAETAAPPAEQEGEISPVETAPKGRRLTPSRIIALILALLVLISATSVAFSRGGTTKKTDSIFDSEEDELPENAWDFFSQYYEDVQSDHVEVNLKEAESRPDYTMVLQQGDGEKLSLQEIYENCSGSIVAIRAYEGSKVGYNWGTGVVVTADGLILTNTHVLEDSDRAVVMLGDDTEYEAELIGADAVSDIALIRIEAEGLTPAVFGDSANLQVGDEVAAIGNPLGESFRNTLTNGIISAIERGMNYHGRTMTLLQTNTAINEGNSGGPLFNRYGQVIGITNMKMMSSYSSIEGIGFAIPSATVCEVVNALIRDGKVVGRPAIGITVGEIPEAASSRYELPEGIYVSAVQENTDAAKKGVQAGDVITAVNGEPVKTTEDINRIKNTLQVGEEIHFTIWREGETLEISVELMDTNDVY